MKPGDMVQRKSGREGESWPKKVGLFIGMRTFSNGRDGAPYTCAEVMWLNQRAPNGDVISTIQPNLIEVVND